MIDWKELYKEKVLSADEAIRRIPGNTRIFSAQGASEPRVLLKALSENYEYLDNVELTNWTSFVPAEYCEPKCRGHIKYNSMFISDPVRQYMYAGSIDYTPIAFYQTPQLFLDGSFTIDVAMISVTPPDKDGYVSIGTSMDGTLAAIESSKLVIAQVNDNLPHTLGQTNIHVSEITYLVEGTTPLPELIIGNPSPEEEALGENIASIVEDGSTIQLGIGKIPNVVAKCLQGKKDLGVHSEMVSDGIADLYESGAITGKYKAIDKGLIVTTLVLGTKKVYDFVSDNPIVSLRPVSYVNNPLNICKNPKVVAVNACLEMDLNGQVNAESFGLLQYSGIGGQSDYVRGAMFCPDSKSVIAMTSTAKNGTVSRIVPVFEPGTIVTTPRTDIHYVATEYGIVNLRGKTARERSELLISIAHPKFRDELMEEVRRRYKGIYY